MPPSAGSAYQYSLPIPAPSGTLRGVDAPALPAGFRSLLAEAEAEADRPFTPAPTPPPRPVPAPFPVTVDPNPPLPVFLWPVVAVNWVLEGLLGLLGPVGADADPPGGETPARLRRGGAAGRRRAVGRPRHGLGPLRPALAAVAALDPALV